MKHFTIIASSVLLISSYIFTAEKYPQNGKLSPKPALKKDNRRSPSITLHNKLHHYDITTPNTVIIPGESKKIYLNAGENLELAVFVDALDHELTLEFEAPLPKNVYFTKKSDCIEVAYDDRCLGRYAYK
jgi:hypothetical protein